MSFGTAARQSGDTWSANFGRHGLHGFEVPLRGYGESGLDHVYAKALELTSHAQLLVLAHAVAWGLFAIAQRGVEYLDPFSF